MQLDALTNFVQPGATPVTMVGAAGTAIQIGQTIDLLGAGVGVAPPGIIGNTTLWGVDPGIGQIKPVISIYIGTAATTGTAATGQFALQYAADQGSAGAYQPDTWYTSSETEAHAASVLSAGQQVKLDLTPAPPEVPTPRFVRLLMKVPTATNFTAGTVVFAGLTMARDDQTNRQAANNYVVA